MGTKIGELLLVENLETATLIEASPAEGNALTSIAQWPSGIILGLADGAVHFLELSADKTRLFAPLHVLNLHCGVLQLAWVEAKGLCFATLDDQTIWMVSSQQLEGDEDNKKWLTFNRAGGSGRVNGVDVCLRKKQAATCSNDKFIRLWDLESLDMILQAEFESEAFSIC